MTNTNSTSYHSPQKIFSMGHSQIQSILEDEVTITEKTDGSFFAFGIFDGVIKCRSKGQQIEVNAPEKMFTLAVEQVKELSPQLHDGWTYRGEYLNKPKHNALAYNRTPVRNIILFDICTGEEAYLPYDQMLAEATRLGLETVPLIYQGMVNNHQMLVDMLDRVSILGGQKIEGIVVKNYKRFARDGKAMFGKLVSDTFKEVHKNDWKKINPKQGDVLERLSDQYHSKTRWNKAIQHLEEKGLLKNGPEDIPLIFKEIHNDLLIECESEIKQELFDWAIDKIKRKATLGFPNWYKDRLAQSLFQKEEVKC